MLNPLRDFYMMVPLTSWFNPMKTSIIIINYGYIYQHSRSARSSARRLDVAMGAEAKRRCVELVEEAEEAEAEEVQEGSLAEGDSLLRENQGFHGDVHVFFFRGFNGMYCW